MSVRQARSFCRICSAHCGMVLTIDDDSQPDRRRQGDKDNPTVAAAMSASRGCRRRRRTTARPGCCARSSASPTAAIAEIDSEQALDEIADKLRDIVAARRTGGGGDVQGHAGHALRDPHDPARFPAARSARTQYLLDQHHRPVGQVRQLRAPGRLGAPGCRTSPSPKCCCSSAAIR